MIRPLLWVSAVCAVTLLPATVQLDACGDKFIRLGQSSRHKTYAAVNRASILVYVPKGVKAGDVRAFESALKRAGHTPLSVRSMDALVQALRQRTFDIVVTGIVDAGAVQAQAASVSPSTDVLPVVSKRPNDAPASAAHGYRFVIDVDGPRLSPLATIDDLMEVRLGRARSTAAVTH
jgi:hypothetical protein